MKRLLKIALFIAGGTVLGIVAIVTLPRYTVPTPATGGAVITSAEYGDRWPLPAARPTPSTALPRPRPTIPTSVKSGATTRTIPTAGV